MQLPITLKARQNNRKRRKEWIVALTSCKGDNLLLLEPWTLFLISTGCAGLETCNDVELQVQSKCKSGH